MKRALVVLLGALALFPAASGAAPAKAWIRVSTLTPFTVHGAGFVPGEAITVTVDANRHVVRRTNASATGAFTVQLRTIHPVKCSSYTVRVRSSHGTTIAMKTVPECAPPAGGDGNDPNG